MAGKRTSTQKFKKFHGRTFGDRLYWLRTFKGFTLEEFGALIGCHKSYLSRLESGDVAEPSEKLINVLCGRIMVDRDWLLTGAGDPFGHTGGFKFIMQGGPKTVSQERLGRVLAMLEDVAIVLEPEVVLEKLLRNVSSDEIRAVRDELMKPGVAQGAFAKMAFWVYPLADVLLRREK